jgi:predicted nuclease of predicted toxin-antitoxin system
LRHDVTIWLDNQLPPALTTWVRTALGVECTSVRDLALQRAADLEIFHAARNAGALVMTKDADFAALVHQFGAPPQIVLVTCGNTSNAHLRQVVVRHNLVLPQNPRIQASRGRYPGSCSPAYFAPFGC